MSPGLHGPPQRGPPKRVGEPSRIWIEYVHILDTLPVSGSEAGETLPKAPKGGRRRMRRFGRVLGAGIGSGDASREGTSPFYPTRLGEPGFRNPEFGLARVSVASLCHPQELGVLTSCRLHVSVHKVHAGRTNRTRACEVPPASHICCASSLKGRSMGTRTRPYPHLRCSGKRKPSATAACTQCT